MSDLPGSAGGTLGYGQGAAVPWQQILMMLREIVVALNASKLGKAISASVPANPVGTASLVGVMMGLAGTITPTSSGRVLIIVSGDIANSVMGDGANVQLRVSSAGGQAAPVNGAALIGTTVGGLVKYTASAAGAQVPFTVMGYATGLTIGSPYWIDLSLAAVTGGVATIADLSIVAMEQ